MSCLISAAPMQLTMSVSAVAVIRHLQHCSFATALCTAYLQHDVLEFCEQTATCDAALEEADPALI